MEGQLCSTFNRGFRTVKCHCSLWRAVWYNGCDMLPVSQCVTCCQCLTVTCQCRIVRCVANVALCDMLSMLHSVTCQCHNVRHVNVTLCLWHVNVTMCDMLSILHCVTCCQCHNVRHVNVALCDMSLSQCVTCCQCCTVWHVVTVTMCDMLSVSHCVTVVPMSHCAGREVWRSHGWRLEQWRYSLRTSRGTFHPHCIANYRQIPMPSVPWLCWLGVRIISAL